MDKVLIMCTLMFMASGLFGVGLFMTLYYHDILPVLVAASCDAASMLVLLRWVNWQQ